MGDKRARTREELDAPTDGSFHPVDETISKDRSVIKLCAFQKETW